MHRFFIPPEEFKANDPVLRGDEWRHCQTVLRAVKGDRLSVFDGKGNEYLALLEEAMENQARLRVVSHHATPRPSPSVTLVQAIAKNKSMEVIVQKATELGVHSILPVLSERSVVRIPSDEAQGKLDRWRQISIEAAKQCGLNWLPEVGPMRTVKEAAALRSGYTMALIASLQADAKSLRYYLPTQPSSDEKVILMIGPEGDFTPAEMNHARSAGFQPLSLGPLVLRCETAVIYALSLLSYELGANPDRLLKNTPIAT